MSKAIIIQKNGIAQTLTVDKLRLPDAAGGTENWLPADGKNLVNLEVKQNGTYRASDFSAYGIAEVKVKCTLNGGAAVPKATEKLLNALHHPAPAEGGRARTMSAHHLETPQDGGGTVQWVPEDVVSLGTKSINVDNRTYKSADDGKYGWSQFTVSGITIERSKSPDGETVVTHTDGTGTKTFVVPDYIWIEREPDVKIYGTNAYIGIDGIIVKAFTNNGKLWTDENHPDGIIPAHELTFTPEVTAQGTGECINIDGIVINQPLEGYGSYTLRSDTLLVTPVQTQTIQTVVSGGNLSLDLNGPANTAILYKNDERIYTGQIYNGVVTSVFWVADPVTLLATPAYEYSAGGHDYGFAGTYPVADDGREYVTIKWERPGDGEILTAGYYILVIPFPNVDPGESGDNPGYGGAEGGGGQTSGGGAGRDN